MMITRAESKTEYVRLCDHVTCHREKHKLKTLSSRRYLSKGT